MLKKIEKRDVYIQEAVNCADVPDSAQEQITSYFIGSYTNCQNEENNWETIASKYKPIAFKVKPVYLGVLQVF